MKTVKTTDTYEASYYLMNGATIETIRTRNVPSNKQEQKGLKTECILHLKDVPEWAYLGWNEGICYADIIKFSKMRIKLKKLIKNYV